MDTLVCGVDRHAGINIDAAAAFNLRESHAGRICSGNRHREKRTALEQGDTCQFPVVDDGIDKSARVKTTLAKRELIQPSGLESIAPRIGHRAVIEPEITEIG